MPLAVTVAPETFLAIVACSALAATIAAAAAARGLALPVVVVELLLGIAIGPQALGLQAGEFVSFFSDLGLGLLFFFAGYEIDLKRIAGNPLWLGLAGWAMSLALAYAFGGRAGGGRGRAVAAVHRLGDGDHGARHAAPVAVGFGRAALPLRDLPARGGRGGRVRADPAPDPDPLRRGHRPQRADPRRLRRARRVGRRVRGALGRAHAPVHGAHDGGERPARGALDRRAGLRARAARVRTRARPAARRLRRRA